MMQPIELIQAYGEVLGVRRGAFGRLKDLPAPKEDIAGAILAVLRMKDAFEPEFVWAARASLVELPAFLDDSDLSTMRDHERLVRRAATSREGVEDFAASDLSDRALSVMRRIQQEQQDFVAILRKLGY